MDRFSVPVSVALAAALVFAGCSGSSPAQPEPTTAIVPPAPAPLAESAGVPDFLAAQFTLTLDPATMQAAIEPLRGGSAQPPQNLQYDLDIARFQARRVLEATDISFDAEGNVVVGLRHRHPFPAPNVAQPATASNRCDLSYTGRLVVLAQGPTQSFFGGEVQADPSLVIDPDGFVRPGGLLRSPAPPPHNTFPYLLLVDEAKDNRVGLSNGGNHTGNYVPSFGWQTGTLGPNGTGWYGYDYFHAGQETDLRLVLRRERLTTPARVPLALLIKYTDPRGAGGRTHRFPAAPPDIAQFCYRLPYAALDVSSLRIVQPIALSDVNGTAEVVAAVRDWDASAQESSDHDLSDEGDPKKIQPGAAGAPLLQLDAPRIGDTIQLLPEGGSGVPADPLIYRGTLSNTAGATAGMYVGMLQAVDPEDGDAQAASYRFGLDPHTLAPSPDRALEVRTFQAVPITVQFTGPEILSVSPTGVIGALSDMVTFRAVTTNSPTQWIWEFDGGTVPGSSTEETPTVELFSAGTFSGSLTVGNAAGFSEPFEFSYTILAEAQPGWGLAWGGSRQEFAHEVVASPAGDVFFGGSMSWSGIWQEPIDIDPTPTEDIRQINNDFDAYAIRLGPQGDYRWGLLAGGDWDDIMYDGQHDQVRGMALDWDRGALVLTGQYCGENVDFDPGPGTAGTPPPLGTHWSFLAKYDLDGNLVWLKNWGSDEPYVREDFGQDVALDPAGNLYVLGSCRAGADMDPGLGQTVAPGAVGDEWQVFLSKFDPQGNLLWCRFWETFYAYNYDASLHVSGADLVIASTYNNFVTPRFDLDPGPGELIGPESEDPRSWLVKLDLGGTFAGGWTWGGGDGIASARAVARDTAANIFVTGSFCCGGVDFDPGPGQEVRTPHDGSDGYVLALGPNGGFRWLHHWTEGSGGLEWGQDITVDAQGSVVVAGTTGPSDYNATVRKLTGAGVPEWDRGVGADAKGTAVAIVNGTGILFAGEYSGEIDLGFGGPPDMRDGFEDHFLVRLKPNGTR